jgi:hypothetical protein
MQQNARTSKPLGGRLRDDVSFRGAGAHEEGDDDDQSSVILALSSSSSSSSSSPSMHTRTTFFEPRRRRGIDLSVATPSASVMPWGRCDHVARGHRFTGSRRPPFTEIRRFQSNGGGGTNCCVVAGGDAKREYRWESLSHHGVVVTTGRATTRRSCRADCAPSVVHHARLQHSGNISTAE